MKFQSNNERFRIGVMLICIGIFFGVFAIIANDIRISNTMQQNQLTAGQNQFFAWSWVAALSIVTIAFVFVGVRHVIGSTVCWMKNGGWTIIQQSLRRRFRRRGQLS